MIDTLPAIEPGNPVTVWHRPPSDELFGIEAIAAYLALPFLDVRTMLEMGRLPSWKTGRAHTARRSALAAHFAELERASVPADMIEPLPEDVGPNDTLGLLSGQPAIAAYLGCSPSGVRHRRARDSLVLFWIGKTPFARRASIDRWRRAVAGRTRSTRRLDTIHGNRIAAAPPGSIVGVAAIAAALGTTPRAVFMSLYRDAGRIPAFRVGNGWAADPAALAACPYQPRKETRNGERR